MPSTYTPNLRLELQATGENRSTWGIKANNDFSLIETAISGYLSVAMGDTNITLTTANAATDQARNAVLRFTGANTAIRNVIIPATPKVYLIKNATSGGFGITVKTSTGTGYTVTNGSTRVLYCDGTDVYASASVLNAARLLGRASTIGEAEEIPVGFGLEFSGGTLQVKSSDLAGGVPVGARMEMTGTVVPSGFLAEDGGAYSRTTYADLFAYYQSGFTSQTFTVTIATPAVVTKASHGFNGGERVRFSTTGVLPTGLNSSTDYFVTIIDTNTFRLSTSQVNYEAGSYVATSGSQSGVHSYLQSLYGLGDGSTTFNVADRRNKFSISLGSSRTVGTELASQNKAHAHGVTDPGHNHGHSDPGHAHGVSDPGHSHTSPTSVLRSGSANTGNTGTFLGNYGVISIAASGTGIGIAGAGTGMSNVAATTGITIQSSGATDGYPRHLAVLSCVKY